MTSQASAAQKERVRTFLKFGPEPHSLSSSILRESIVDDKPFIRLGCTGESCTFCDKKQLASGQKPRHTDRETKFIQKDAQDFAFEKIYGPSSTVADYFEEIGVPAVERAVAGKHSVVIVSGGIASEKNTIIYGSAIDAPGAPVLGLVQSCCIRAVEMVASNPTARFSCKFIEVNANEDINDLIDPQRKFLGVKENNGRVHVDGVYAGEFKNIEEAQYFIGLGIHHGNLSSTRSHRILTIEVALETERVSQHGSIKFVDIAALAETPRRHISVATSPNTPREAGGLNKGVLAIRSCIDSLILARPYIPWRDSKISFLLKDYFRSDFAVSFLITVSSDSKYLSESLQLMALGASARKIEIAHLPAKVMKFDKISAVASYKREISELHEKIQSLQSMQLIGSESSQVQKFKERMELLTKIIFFLMDPKKAQEIQDMETPSISADELHKVFRFQIQRVFRDVQILRDQNDFASLQRINAMGQSMSISPQVRYFGSPAHWSLLSCNQMTQSKAEVMFDIAEWETKFQEAYHTVNVAIKAYSVYSTSSTLPNDVSLEQFLKYIVNFMFGRLVDKKSGSLVYLLTRPATRQKILHLSENVISAERSLKFQQHVLADNSDAVAVIATISTWISQFYFRLLDLVRILKTFNSSEGPLLPEQAKFNSTWLFSSVSTPLVWQKCSNLSDLCLGNIYRSGNPSVLNLSPRKQKDDVSLLFTDAAKKLQIGLQSSCNAIIDMLNQQGKKFLTNCCIENKLLPVEDHVIDCDLCKVSYPDILEMSPLILLDSFLVIFSSQKNVDLSLLTIIDTKRVQKLRCYSESARETNEMEHVLEILSLNEFGQPYMVCLNFGSVLRRSCWVANLQRFHEIEPDIGDEMAQSSLSQKESKLTQALEKYTAQSGRTETHWGIRDEASTQKMQTLEAELLIQEAKMEESELANILSHTSFKPGEARSIAAIGTEIFTAAGASGIPQRSTTTKISEHATASISNTSPKKDNATSAQSASFVASFSKPSQPSVEVKVPTAGDLIFARDEVKLTAIQKAIETGATAVPSLRQGELLIKFNKGSSKNMERYVMLLDKTNMIVWGGIEKLTSNLNLREVLGISLGMGSSTLRRAYCTEDHHTLPKLTNGTILSFPACKLSISFFGAGRNAPALNLVFSLHCANRSYDFAALSEGSFLAWVLGLQVACVLLCVNSSSVT